MSAAQLKSVADRPTSINGDQIVRDLFQIGTSDGINPVAVNHTFHGVTTEGVVYPLASLNVTESGVNTQIGSIGLNTFDTDGNTTPVLDVGEGGMTVHGGLNVVGGSAIFETSIIEVEDKSLVLASGSITTSDLDGGGVILGNTDSGTIQYIYDVNNNNWNSSVGINIGAGHALTIGDTGVILDETGLILGNFTLDSDGYSLGDDVSLGPDGLIIGDISLTTLSGLLIGDDITMNTTGIILGSTNPVVLDTTGITIGSELSLNIGTGLLIGDDLSLTPSGGLEIGTDISLTSSSGLQINDISLTTDGLTVGGDDPIVLNPAGLTFPDLQLSTSTGLSISDNVVLNDNSLTIGPAEDVIIDNNGITVGDFGSFTKTGGMNIGTDMSLSEDSITFGTAESTIIDDSSVALGSDILLNHDGLYLTNEQSAVYLGGTTWKIAYDSTTQNLLFQFYDSVSGTYITKTEIKNSS